MKINDDNRKKIGNILMKPAQILEKLFNVCFCIVILTFVLMIPFMFWMISPILTFIIYIIFGILILASIGVSILPKETEKIEDKPIITEEIKEPDDDYFTSCERLGSNKWNYEITRKERIDFCSTCEINHRCDERVK